MHNIHNLPADPAALEAELRTFQAIQTVLEVAAGAVARNPIDRTGQTAKLVKATGYAVGHLTTVATVLGTGKAQPNG